MFILDQVKFSTKYESILLGKSEGILVSGTTMEFEWYIVVVWCPVLKRECVNNRTSLNFDSQ